MKNVEKVAQIILSGYIFKPKTPSEYFNLPVIGVVEVKNVSGKGPNQKIDVIHIMNDRYVSNEWYKEEKHIPQVIHKDLVVRYTKK
jgi:hypothetical protein